MSSAGASEQAVLTEFDRRSLPGLLLPSGWDGSGLNFERNGALSRPGNTAYDLDGWGVDFENTVISNGATARTAKERQ